MKRSEILKEIENILESFYHRKDEEFEVLASVLLNEIEYNPKIGMLPPDIFSEGCDFECNAVYEWEEE